MLRSPGVKDEGKESPATAMSFLASMILHSDCSWDQQVPDQITASKIKEESYLNCFLFLMLM